jgi:hypothetical protein
MRKQVMAIAARVNAAKRMLDAAEVHIRDAAVEEDPQHSTALLTLGGELADYAELILRNVNDGPEPLQEPEAEVPTGQPTTPLQWREDFNDGTFHAERDKYRATVQQAQAGEWAWRVNFDGHFRQYGTAESLIKAMQQAEDCIVARIIRNATVDAELAVMP